MVRADVTPEFIAEHGMGALWNTAMDPQLYYRRVVAVDVPAQTITLDAPTRYALKTRDNARVYQVAPHLEEVGVEHLAMGMKENLAPGLGDQDYTVPGTAAYDAHASKAILYDHVVNGWIREVKSYRPETNTQDWHTLSNGVELNRSRFVTVAGCHFAKPQYRGAGGNGYAYNHGGNDCLITRSTGEKGRHNFSFKTLLASGSVIHRSTAIDGLLPSDFHRHLTVAGLVDNLTLVRDFFEARLRPFGNPPLHGHSAAQSVFWNLTGQEASPGNPFVVLSSQFGWGYVIGTRGSVTGVQVTPQAGAPDAGTEPVDYVEGVGLGGGLVPESLYEDQLARRRPKVGDFDGDRRADVLWRKVAAGVDKGAMFLWTMHGTGLAGARYLDPISEDWQVQFMGDFNGDGKGDVLWRNMNAASADAGKLYLWMMNGPFVAGGTGYTASQADLGWRVDGVGDLNGDGKSDIVWRKTAAGVDKGAVFLWPMNGTGIVGPRYLDPISEDWQVVDLGDFNGDGKADVLWRNMNAMSPDAGKLYIWMMDGANVIAGTGYTASQADLGWRVDGVGDLNGDGKDDIVWRKIGAGVDKGAVFLWTMNGTGFAGARYLDPIGEDWQVQGVGDFNGDGKTDILWRNQGPGTDIGNLYIWMMDGPNVVGGTGYTAAQADLGWRVDSPKK
jgi:hypothetical protein